MVTQIKFGTDGWRGVIAEDFTFANVRLCAQSVASYLRKNGLAERGLVVGYDTRFASEHFARAVAEVVAANGIKVYLCDRPSPTPVVSYSILTQGAGGAVVITASHNPSIYNGLKYKPEYAGSASPEVVAELEEGITRWEGEVKGMPLDEARERRLVEDLNPAPAYLEHLAQLVDLEPLRNAGLRVVADSMYGSGAGYFQGLLSGGKTEILEINGERNPLFPGIQPEPIARNLGKLMQEVPAQRAHVGLATDGDSDRIGVVDERGNFLTPLQVFALLILYLLEAKGERGPIVKSLTTTAMANRLGELYGVPVYEMPVGFKYIGPKMISEKALIGGEESGGFGFRGHIPERDGILAGLYFLDLMLRLGRSPSQLLDYLYAKVGPHYYERWDLDFPAAEHEVIINRLASAQPRELDGKRVVGVDTRDGFRFLLEDGSWLLVRFSGTEPIMRIYCETGSPERVKRLLAAGKRLAGL